MKEKCHRCNECYALHDVAFCYDCVYAIENFYGSAYHAIVSSYENWWRIRITYYDAFDEGPLML